MHEFGVGAAVEYRERGFMPNSIETRICFEYSTGDETAARVISLLREVAELLRTSDFGEER